MTPEVDRVIEKAVKDPEILAVFLFGSRARDEAHAAADLEKYVGELESIRPSDFKGFSRTERKRACERLLQISRFSEHFRNGRGDESFRQDGHRPQVGI